MGRVISFFGRVIDFVRYTPNRLQKIWKLVNDPVSATSYYPEEKRKSKFLIFLDLLWWMLEKGEVNHYYFLYGFDRKDLKDKDEYLGHKEFWRYQEQARNSAALLGVQMNYQCLTNDKLVFSRYLSSLNFPTPKTIAVGDSDSISWLDESNTSGLDSLVKKEMDVFCKDLFGVGGVGVFPLKVNSGKLYIDGEESSLDDLRNRLTARWMLQERIKQHSEMSRLYPHSVNTIRVCTILKDGQAKLLYSNLRVGNKGSACDNFSIGGIAIGIDMDSGHVQKDGYLKPAYGTRVTSHPDTGLVFEGFEIPYYKEAVELALKLHSYCYGIYSIGWDVAITENGPCFIEANDNWLVAMPQGLYGGLRSKYLELYPEVLLV